MKKIRIAETAICFALSALVAVLSVFYALPGLNTKAVQKKENTVVRLWNIDTFEGGKGSRTAFLSRAARLYEKSEEGVYIMVESYTVEGAKAAFAAGNAPDMLSFGLGFSDAAEKCLKLNGRSFSGGTVGGECRAMPWCRGVYSLFCLEDGFADVNRENTVLSLGGRNLPEVAAALHGLEGKEAESTAAYVNFLNGKYKYLLGTQRDVCRFAARGVQIYVKTLENYSDLYQYIAVITSKKAEKRVCEGFFEALFSEKIQKKLPEIGMLSPFFDVYNEADGVINDLESASVRFTLNVFTSDTGLKEVLSAASGKNKEVLKNFLKEI